MSLKDITHDKEQMIRWLVHDDLNDWETPQHRDAYIGALLRTGIKGYNDWTMAELSKEVQSRIGDRE